MKKIEIEIPSDLNNKNSVFSHCLSFLRTKISNNNELEGNLSPLGNTELISEKNLAGIISKTLNKGITESQLSFYIREYNKESGNRIDPIKKYSKVSDSKVYLLSDTENLRNYIMKKAGN